MAGEESAHLKPVVRLAESRRAWYGRIAYALVWIALLVAISFFILLDIRLSMPPIFRWGLWFALFGTGFYFLFQGRSKVNRIYTPGEAAGAIEAARPELGQKLRTAWELTEGMPSGTDTFGFREKLVSDSERWLNSFDWRALVPSSRGIKLLGLVLLLGLSLLIISGVSPEFRLGMQRILFPGTTTTYTQLTWESPPEWFDQRHPPLVKLKVSGRDARPTLFVKEEVAEEWEEVSLSPRENSDTWDAVLSGREGNLAVYATAGDGKSTELNLLFEPIPELREAKVKMVFPEYLEREDEETSGGDVRAVEGTKLQWSFTFNTIPAKVEWTVSGEKTKTELEPGLTCVTDVYELEAGTKNPILTVTDKRGRPVDSWRFEVEGLIDKLPEVEILEPAKDRDATSITELPVRIRAKDDHGLGEVGIVLEARGESRWVLEKVIDVSNQRLANEMVSAMLEEIPLEITDNVRIYAYALDRKPRGGPRALSHLRSIDIRQFKRRWKFGVAPPGGIPKREDLIKLEKIISKQRGVVSEVFVLKGGGRDSISQELFEKCSAEAAREDALALEAGELAELWESEGRIEADDIVLLEVAGEQMNQAATELRVPKRDEAFDLADSSLSNLLKLRKKLMTLILKSEDQEGEPLDPKEIPPSLTKLSDEARRLAAEEAEIRSQLEIEKPAEETDPSITRRQQDVAIFDAGELYSNLLTHPEKTEGALTLMNEAEIAMLEAGRKLDSSGDKGAVLDLALAEQRLLELAEFLTLLEMEMTSSALEEMANEAEKEAKDLGEAATERKDKGEEAGESEVAEEKGNDDSDGPEHQGDKQSEEKPGSGEKGIAQEDGKKPGKESKGDEGEKGQAGKGKEKSDGKSAGEQLADSGKQGQAGKGEESRNGKGKEDEQTGGGTSGQSGEGDAKEAGESKAELLAKAARRARLTDELLKALAEREAGKGRMGDDAGNQNGNGGEENDRGEPGEEGGRVPGSEEGTESGEQNGGPGGEIRAEALAELRRELKMGELADALNELQENGEPGKGRGDEDSDGEGQPLKDLAERFEAAGKRMREFAGELNSSQLAQLAEVKSEIEKLKGKLDSDSESKGSGDGNSAETDDNPFAALNQGLAPGGESVDQNEARSGVDRPGADHGPGQGPLTEELSRKLNRLEDEAVRRWGAYLRAAPFDRNSIPILDAIEKRVDELVGEIPQITVVEGGRRAVPENSRQEIEDYFRDLSDDFGEEGWIKKKK